jgi:hypothetical protein
MASAVYYSPFIPAFSGNGLPVPAAKLYFYYTGTTNPAPIYSDAGLTSPMANPVESDLAGRFDNIYLNSAVTYRVRITTSAGAPVGSDIDPYIPGAALKGDPGSNVMAISLFTAASTLSIPVGTDVIQTSGYSTAGIGLARYGYSTVVNTAYVTANPRTSFISANGRGFRLAEPFITAPMFGAIGDGTTDDTAAIQAALNHVGVRNGGTVFLPKALGHYRITSVLRLPAYTILEGMAPVGYPYDSDPGHSGLVADFSTPNQWVIEADTQNSGSRYAYNVMVSGSLPSAPAYNCGVRNLLIRSTGANMPYGGIRLHGAPKGIIEGVGVVGVGIGALVNYSFGGRIQIHSMGRYYGVVLWDDANANQLDIYCARDDTSVTTVPVASRIPALDAFNGLLVSPRNMATDAHIRRPQGLVVGSTSSLCVGNSGGATIEHYTGGMFVINASGLLLQRTYVEGSTGEILCAVAATNSQNIHLDGIHMEMSAGGVGFDLGSAINGTLRLGGYTNYGGFGTGPWFGDNSTFDISGSSPSDFGPNPPRVGQIKHQRAGAWIAFPAAAGGWTNNTTYPPKYRINGECLELKGFATGGTTSTTAWTLPVGYRPVALQNLAGGFGGQVAVDSTGTIQLGSGTVLGLDGISVPLT